MLGTIKQVAVDAALINVEGILGYNTQHSRSGSTSNLNRYSQLPDVMHARGSELMCNSCNKKTASVYKVKREASVNDFTKSREHTTAMEGVFFCEKQTLTSTTSRQFVGFVCKLTSQSDISATFWCVMLELSAFC
eukprot:4229041-Amphidinium_carterae.3